MKICFASHVLFRFYLVAVIVMHV